jgi:ubiquinone/menaquinone biosynthesis C-methylase UbiE
MGSTLPVMTRQDSTADGSRKRGPRDSSQEDDRRRVLEAIAQTYGDYASSGRTKRWIDPTGGAVLALRERDRWLLDCLAPAMTGTVLDLGCGHGNLAVMLDQADRRPADFVGVDILEERLVIARSRAPWATFIQASADRLPLADSSADAAVASTLFSSLPDPWFREQVATEIKRVVRPGGRVIVYDLRYPSPGNPRVRPVSLAELERLFDGWTVTTQSMTLIPPLARSPFAAGAGRYRALVAIPFLRSHLGAVLERAA